MKSPKVETLGIPVKAVTHVVLKVGLNREGKPQVYSAMAQNAANFILLVIDPETGAFRQIFPEGEKHNYPNAPIMSRSGRLYIGAAYSGHLFYFDPEKDALIDAGLIHEGSTFPCGLDEDASGKIWIGSYGDADLTSYDPSTGAFKGYGRMDEVDMYNKPLVNADGLICNVISTTRPHVVVLDPKTGEKDRRPGCGQGKGQARRQQRARQEGLHRVKPGQLPDRRLRTPSRSRRSRRGSLRPRNTGSPPFPSSTGPTSSSASSRSRRPTAGRAVFDLNWEGAGTEIFVLHQGPDSLLYGSSILPEHLFRYDPASGRNEGFGPLLAVDGRGVFDGQPRRQALHPSYTGARISVYDPAKPYDFGETPESNPRDLGRIDDISYRPRSIHRRAARPRLGCLGP